MEKIIGDEGKIVITLKIPKLETAAMEGDKSPGEDVIGILSTSSSKTMEEGRRVCLECQKEFNSGKALGGHMRVHVQSAKKNPNILKLSKASKLKKNAYQDYNNGYCNMKKEPQQLKPYYINSVNDEGKPTCSQCGKTFPSMKSLFGHMRCHPERVWRGILPPPNTPTTPAAAARRRTFARNKPNSSASASSFSSSSANGLNTNERSSKVDGDGGDQVVDLTKLLRGWSVTGGRGRKALKLTDDDEVLMEAVEDLMSLANGGPSMAESGVSQRQLKVELDDADRIKNVSDNESDSSNTHEQLLISYKFNKNSVNSSNRCPNKIKRRKKMKLMMELEQNADVTVVTGGSTPLAPLPEQQQQPVTGCKYKCTTCNKCFTSHQALGGHRSSHNKSKSTSTDQHQIEEDDNESFLMNQSGKKPEKEIEFVGFLVAPASGTTNSNSSVHQCKIFATGQALGGHKRCHLTGTIEAEAPSSQLTSTGEGASQTGGGRKVLDFDLNEIPPIMMEEDEAANVNGNGHASSSHNSDMGWVN